MIYINILLLFFKMNTYTPAVVYAGTGTVKAGILLQCITYFQTNSEHYVVLVNVFISELHVANCIY